VAAHAFRELDDRCAAAPAAHAVPRDRHRSVAYVHGPRRHALHEDEVRGLVAEIEKLELLPEVPERSRACRRATSWWCCRTAIPTCWRRPRSITGCRSSRDLGGRGQSVQAARRDLHQGAEIAASRMDEVLFVANHAFDCIGARPPACTRPSSTGASGRSASRRTSPTSWCAP
jgi:hypothetical protein